MAGRERKCLFTKRDENKLSRTVKQNRRKSLQDITTIVNEGRVNNGELLSELLYSAANLVIFLNDNIFKSASKCLKNINTSRENLQRWLTVLEYGEVFLEMAAKKKWGTYGAWVVICVLQIAKTLIRVYLFVRLNTGIQTSPAILPVDRELLKLEQAQQHDSLEDAWDEEAAYSEQEKTFILKSSGRQIRTLKSAQHNGLRTWTVPHSQSATSVDQNSALKQKMSILNQPGTHLTGRRQWAECLHIARPVAHLLAMYMSGVDSWKPYLLALGMDISSLMWMGDTTDLTVFEKKELRHRTIMLLYYLLRSPFYETHTKAKLVAFLTFFANNVPLTGIIARPILEYLPAWQQMYFYVWAT